MWQQYIVVVSVQWTKGYPYLLSVTSHCKRTICNLLVAVCNWLHVWCSSIWVKDIYIIGVSVFLSTWYLLKSFWNYKSDLYHILNLIYTILKLSTSTPHMRWPVSSKTFHLFCSTRHYSLYVPNSMFHPALWKRFEWSATLQIKQCIYKEYSVSTSKGCTDFWFWI